MTQHITPDAIGKTLHGRAIYAPHIESDAVEVQFDHDAHGRMTVSLIDQNDGPVETRTFQILEVF